MKTFRVAVTGFAIVDAETAEAALDRASVQFMPGSRFRAREIMPDRRLAPIETEVRLAWGSSVPRMGVMESATVTLKRRRKTVWVWDCKCERCGHTWESAADDAPARCPGCKQRNWNRDAAWSRPDRRKDAAGK